ncbi:MAG: hypothetical protein ACTHJ1_05150 [Bordetella sp.]|uniref:hypothetical protein n=1 Tax=Bordetella sp. TaxID=28081 RepID=UPI003F7BAAAC
MTEAISADCLRRRIYLLTGDSKKSISASDIKELPLDRSLIEDICGCLKSNDVPTLSIAFFFLETLLQKYTGEAFGGEFFTFLVKRIRDLLNHESKFICSKALAFFIWLRENYSDYREIMLDYLASSDLGLRKIALSNFETYAIANEISPLIRFSTDDYAAEYSMMGEMRYDLRDIALEKIELIVKRKFRMVKLTESHDGGTVSWYDWRQFKNWWRENHMKFR